MVEHMEKRGCKVEDKDFFVVRHCDEKVGGGFDESASKHGGVVLCQNHIRDYQHTGRTLPDRDPWRTTHAFMRQSRHRRLACSRCDAAILTELLRAELTLTHELVHAYDHCRAFVDWSNCVHHACSEIRAAHLSGDCRM